MLNIGRDKVYSGRILLGWKVAVSQAVLRPGSFCQDFELPTNLPAWPSIFFYEHSQSIAISQHLTFFCCLSKHSMSNMKMCSGSEGKYHAEYPSGTCPHLSETSHVQPTTVTCHHRCYRRDTCLPFQHRTTHTTETKSWDPSTERGKYSSLTRRNELPQFPHRSNTSFKP